MDRRAETQPTGRETSPPASGASGSRLWRASIAALVLSICASLLAGTIADPDLWGHVLFGKLTLALGGVARVDPYAYASSGTWINHEWLAEVLFGATHDLLGGRGLVLLKVVLGIALLGWLYRRIVRGGLDVVRGGGVLLLIALPLVLVLGSLRPHVFTFLLFAGTLGILRRAEASPVALWWLVPVMALWVNVHGGFLAGLGVAGVWVGVSVLWPGTAKERDTRRPGNGLAARIGKWVPPLLAAAAATLVNPYGPELVTFLLETATVPRPHITEWQPVRITGSLGIVYLLLVGGGVATLWRADESPPAARLAVLAITALAPLVAVRHLPLFALAVGVLLDDTFGPAWGSKEFAGIASRPGWIRRLSGAAAGLVALVALVRTAGETSCVAIKFSEEIRYPVRAVALLDASGVEADVATFFNWGEYAIWHLAPRIRVGMDGRRETVYPDSIYRSYLRFIGGTEDWDAFLETGPADLALVPPNKPAYNLLNLDVGWALAYEDSVAGLFGRSGSALTDRVRNTPAPEVPVDGEGTCFP